MSDAFDEMDEIWALYADDGAQALDAMEASLLALQAGEDPAAHVGPLFRAVHTFKGNSRVLGLSVVESRAHLCEDLIGLVRDEGVPMDGEIVEILLFASDTLRAMLEETAAGRADVDGAGSEELMDQLRGKIARCSGARTAAAEPGATAVEAGAAATAEAAAAVAGATAAETGASATAGAATMETGAVATATGATAAETGAAARPAAEPSDAWERIPETGAPSAAAEALPVSGVTVPSVADILDLLDDRALPDTGEATGAPQGENDGPTGERTSPAGPPPEAGPAAVPPVAEPARPAARLADDPVYRAIFRDMATAALSRFRAQIDAFATDPAAAAQAARAEADGLCHAARQMGLDEWEAALAAFLSDDQDPERLASLVLELEALSDEPAPPPHPEEKPFFAAIAGPLAEVGRLGLRLATGERPEAAERAAAADPLAQAARAQGFVRVAEAAQALAAAEGAEPFGIARLRLYEELAAVEAMMPEAAAAAGVSPVRLLRGLCAAEAGGTLAALDATLNALRSAPRAETFGRFDRLMRCVHHACAHHALDAAAQLAMSLVDLFGRVEAKGAVPDAMLVHIARGFIETIELAFEALAQGETPAMEVLDRLFEEAANVCFVSDGLMTAGAIERRLGLPADFHRVLSPESVRAAVEEMEKGQQFYIVRTDINSDDRTAEAFLDWLSGDQARSITNVTVFRGTETLFDFLISSRLGEADLIEALLRMDPSGRRLSLTQALRPRQDEPAPAEAPGEAPLAQGAAITPEMLETIGEISASQAMVQHLLAELAEADLAEATEALVRQAAGDWAAARGPVRALLEAHGARLQEIVQAGTQLAAQLAALQEETVTLRARPASTVLRPLRTFAETLARRHRREARLTTTGDELALDLALLERLRGFLRGLVALRLDQDRGAPGTLHVSLWRDEERVTVLLQDDGAAEPESPALAELAAAVAEAGGLLRSVRLPGGGMRFHLGLPLSMVVLEGMVVGVDGMRYVLPVESIRTILQADDAAAMTISAAGGQRVLRLSETEIVAIHALRGHPQEGHRERPWPVSRRVYVVLGTGPRSVAIPVDELVGQQLVLLRPLRGVLARLTHLTGLALLAGGDVGMVLSANRICPPLPAEAG
ncbi:chemotaxis protein CheW [Cereibacter johrii]|uniref:chemotaxis protein CheW n=1 Tax=Cereibacter johrii TaxID=445629 RepID=UPI000DCD1DE0|nr:chemotaxis protein CheW [Cereibacter johrii]RAZ83648.1 chemotaxis protein CheA [Cereibacter johrii]